MRNAIDNGEIGDVQAVSITCGQNWRRHAGSWRQDPALSGGGMPMDTGSHT
ncbi:MAG: Gfo/Idh/MocA family oxidoreductase [Chloroflexia bacterium]